MPPMPAVHNRKEWGERGDRTHTLTTDTVLLLDDISIKRIKV